MSTLQMSLESQTIFASISTLQMSLESQTIFASMSTNTNVSGTIFHLKVHLPFPLHPALASMYGPHFMEKFVYNDDTAVIML